MLTKFWAWVYRKTGYMSKHIIELEYDYVMDNLEDFIEDYNNSSWSEDTELRDYIGLQIGLWQCNLKLYRPWGPWYTRLWWRFKRKIKEIL